MWSVTVIVASDLPGSRNLTGLGFSGFAGRRQPQDPRLDLGAGGAADGFGLDLHSPAWFYRHSPKYHLFNINIHPGKRLFQPF